MPVSACQLPKSHPGTFACVLLGFVALKAMYIQSNRFQPKNERNESVRIIEDPEFPGSLEVLTCVRDLKEDASVCDHIELALT